MNREKRRAYSHPPPQKNKSAPSEVEGAVFYFSSGLAMRMYTAIYKKSGKYYSAWVLEVPGANSQGKTKAEAESNLKEALELVLAARENIFAKNLKTLKLPKGPLLCRYEKERLGHSTD